MTSTRGVTLMSWNASASSSSLRAIGEPQVKWRSARFMNSRAKSRISGARRADPAR